MSPESLARLNELAASLGGRTYRHLPERTLAEREADARLADTERLKARLATAEREARRGSGHRAVPHVRERRTHIICQGCHARSVRLPNTRCLSCR